MIQYDETRLAMEALEPQLEELRGALNLDGIKIKLDELEMKTTEPNFWDDPEKSQSVMQQIGQYKQTIGGFEKLCSNRDDVLTMIELAEEENDESMADEVNGLAETVKKEFEDINRPAAGKTGTTDNYQDAWFAGSSGTWTVPVSWCSTPGTGCLTSRSSRWPPRRGPTWGSAP